MAGTVLEFKSVCYKPAAKHMSYVDNASLRLYAGNVLVVKADSDREYAPVADLALGLISPASGEVSFKDMNWADMDAFQEAENRGRIGCVFESAGWISSLNVIDNIALRERHHTRREEEDIRSEVGELVVKAGIKDSYDINLRPAVVSKRRLRVYEWVRASMGNPDLIMLSFPERGAPSASLPYLLKLIGDMADKGSAVMLITDNRAILNHAEEGKWHILGWDDLFCKKMIIKGGGI
jgi:phospholipid/cholesterol/gamma-HCH transport system ATP-binding protein